MRGCIVFVLLLLLTGCKTIPATLDPGELDTLGRIGVISLLRDRISFIYMGDAIFIKFYKPRVYDVGDWRMNEFAREKVVSEIRSNGALEYVDISHDPLDLMKLYDATVRYPYFDYDIEIIKGDLKRLYSKYGVDTLVLLADGIDNNPQFGGSHFSGIGVFQRSVGIIKYTAFVMRVTIKVIDVESMEVMARQGIYKWEDWSNEHWADDFAGLPREKQEDFRRLVLDSLGTGISEQVTRIGLRDIPAGGLPTGSPCSADDQCSSEDCVRDAKRGYYCLDPPELSFGEVCFKDVECISNVCDRPFGQREGTCQ